MHTDNFKCLNRMCKNELQDTIKNFSVQKIEALLSCNYLINLINFLSIMHSSKNLLHNFIIIDTVTL